MNMKRKMIFILLGGILLLNVCGCSNKEEKKLERILQENSYGYGWGEANSEEPINCTEIKDAVGYVRNYFVTASGELYKFNSSQLFPNEKNCIKTEYENISFMYNYNFYDKNHNLVCTAWDKEEGLLTPQEYEEKNRFPVHEPPHIKEDYDFITESTYGDTILIKDHLIYGYADMDTAYDKNPERIELGEIPKDEKIIYISGTLIKTDKAYYTLSTINEEECNKYVETKCEKGFVKSSLTDIYDRIIFAGEDILVDDNYHVYGHGFSISVK